jgi:hypothetical protein
VNRREFFRLAGSSAVAASLRGRDLLAVSSSETGTTLYNGIRLADPWPPRRRSLPEMPVAPPYLVDPPAVVPIDIGRQLFVDDFLIEQSSLVRTFHRAEYHPASPILTPATAWEKRDPYADRTQTHPNPAAMPFSDGVFFDPQSRLFKMWYMGGYQENTCYATSTDGIHWERPSLDRAGTNIVVTTQRDSSTVWIDQHEADPSRRYKMASWHDYYLEQFISPDGIHWTKTGNSGFTGDRTTFFFNPFRNVWVFSLRTAEDPRRRLYWETRDFVGGTRWKKTDPVLWVGADKLDPMRPEYRIPTELYNLDCVAYESILLGLFTIFRGERPEREKPNDVCLGYSRDGFHWARPDRDVFLPVSEHAGDWNWANVQSAGGGCLVVGDKLYFYVSGRQGVVGTNAPGVCSTGLATLRRDGFVSLDHPGDERRVQRLRTGANALPPGTLITRPVRFGGRHLFVNVAAPAGELRAEVLDVTGAPIAPFTAAACVPVRGDSTCARVVWTGRTDLAQVSERPVRFKFTVTNGSLYAFWVAADPNGASGGYVAAGGPGFTSDIDTVGRRT